MVFWRLDVMNPKGPFLNCPTYSIVSYILTYPELSYESQLRFLSASKRYSSLKLNTEAKSKELQQ